MQRYESCGLFTKLFYGFLKRNSGYYYLGEYFDAESQLKTIIYRDKKSGNLQGGTYGICDGIYGMPSMSSPVSVSGTYFISLHFPNRNDVFLSNVNSTIVSDEDRQKILNLAEDDNPVLVFYSLKDFPDSPEHSSAP
ncbi:MAG: hypothetical protein LBD27_05605 [Tannerella sp.]|jgi:hypothetical protein|nr:hypothetical protein [Tannerella sp.]